MAAAAPFSCPLFLRRMRWYSLRFVGILLRAARKSQGEGIFTNLLSPVQELIHRLRGGHLGQAFARVRTLLSDEPLPTFLRKHRDVARLLGRPFVRGLTRRSPRLVTKYLRHYLASGFDKKTRRDILEFHYRFLEARVIAQFSDMLELEPLLWRHESVEPACSIRLAFNPKDHYEGDLSLVFYQDKTYLYEMSFSIVPGGAVGNAAETSLLIARVQGAKDRFDEIRNVTKACGDNAPAVLLACVAFQLAAVLGAKAVVGVSNDEQLWNDEKGIVFDYDRFWLQFGAQRNARGFYEIAIPYTQKPLEEISLSHRRRTRIKREFKGRAAYVAGENFQNLYLRPEFRRHGPDSWPMTPRPRGLPPDQPPKSA